MTLTDRSPRRHDPKAVRYPAAAVDHYRSAGLWGTRTIPAELQASAALHPAAEAVVTAERRVTYAELAARSDAVAARLVDIGLEPGDPVLLQVGNTVETVEAFYGLLKAGAIPVCSLVPFGAHEVEAIARLVGARAHLVQADIATRDLLGVAAALRQAVPTVEHTLTIRGGDAASVRIDDAPPAAPVDRSGDPDDVAVLQLSGGTTGTPKAIPRLHAEYWYNGVATAARCGVEAGDRVGHLLPIVHNAGIHMSLFPAHAVGATLVLAPTWSPEIVVDLMQRERLDHVGTLTSLVFGVLDDPAFLAGAAQLKRLNLAIPAVPADMFDRLSEADVDVHQFFGMSEGFCCASPIGAPAEMRATTVGYPLSEDDEMLLVDPDTGIETPVGEPGELCVRGPYTLRGYYGASAHNATAFTPDGYLRTGDIVRIVDIDGHPCLRIEGRSKDLISRGGEKINASEIEALLVQHPRISAAALVAMPDTRLGERACAFVVTEGAPPELDELRAFLAERGVAKYKWPERLENIDVLPVTPVGKVAKAELRTVLSARLAGPGE